MAARHVEREVKLDVGAEYAFPDLSAVVGGGVVRDVPDQRLHAVYLDSADLRLVRSGVTLRYRRDAATPRAAGRWELKLPDTGASGAAGPRRRDDAGDGCLARLELSWPGGPGTVPDEAKDLVTAYRRAAPLVEVATLVSHRRRRHVCSATGEVIVEVDDDVVTVTRGSHTDRFRQVEVEVVGPSDEQLVAGVVDRLLAAGAVPAPALPKLVRALGARAESPPDGAGVALSPASSLDDVAHAALAAGWARLVANDPGVRLDLGPEAVHQARVATRRLRSDIRTFRAGLPASWAGAAGDELRWLGEALGRVRDADVLSARLERSAASLGSGDARFAGTLLDLLASQRELARSELLAVLRGPRYQRLLDALVAGAAGNAARNGGLDAGPIPAVRAVWRDLARSARPLGRAAIDEQLHAVRIRAKRLRYACEALAGVAGGPAVAMAAAAADLQGVLGDIHDAAAAEQWVRGAVSGAGADEGLVAGLLIAGERARAATRRRRWVGAWRRLDQKELRAWLR